MKITIDNIKSAPEYITIRCSEYLELKHKADRFEKRSTASKNNIKSLNAQRTQKERHELAQKAALARWNKKGE